MEKYITKDEYLIAKGVNLDIELQDDDNKSNKTERFIKEITDWCNDYLLEQYCANMLLDWDHMPSVSQKYFREGVIEQIQYVLNNGLIEQNTGYNENLGVIVNFDKIAMGKTAYRKFHLGGMANI